MLAGHLPIDYDLKMNLSVDYEIAVQLFISFCIGTAIGLEREYHTKAAGLRTMIMICLGSTIFTELSINIGGTANPDRLAASIVTGVGFLGAGVIFKEGITVTGITTATTIWISAALGCAVGAGEYFISIVGSIIILFVLVLLGKVQSRIEKWHQTRTYKIVFNKIEYDTQVEKTLLEFKLKFIRRKDYKADQNSIMLYEISGSKDNLDDFNIWLKHASTVDSFTY